MSSDDSDLEKRFEELRSEEARSIPRFDLKPRRRTRVAPARLVAAAAALVLVFLGIRVGLRDGDPVVFDAADRLAVRTADAWQPPTEFLLKTPGSDLMSTTPMIPDPTSVAAVKGPLP